MNIVTGQIGNAIESVAPDHVVTTSHGIYDQSLEQYQDEINEYLMSVAGNGATYLGLVPPSANPGSQISRVFAFATQAGTYTHFLDDNDNPIVIEKNGLYVLSYVPGDDDYWTCTSLLNESNMPGGVYDISANRAGTSYSSLASALGTNGAHVPAAVRKGGMSVKYVDSNTNKYVQWRYLLASVADADIANANNWQGVDQYPTDGSKNLAESGGVDAALKSLVGYYTCSTAGSTAAKTITANYYILLQGGSIKVKFTNKNTIDDATLKIGSADAKPLFYAGRRASSSNSWEAGEVVEIFYDGTNYYANNVMGGGAGDGAFDISVYNAVEGTPAQYANLSAALGANGANVPASVRKGGMSVKYIQSTDNKYMQARCMATAFSTTPSDWICIDEIIKGDNTPLVGTYINKYINTSGNLIESQEYGSYAFNTNGLKTVRISTPLNNQYVRSWGLLKNNTVVAYGDLSSVKREDSLNVSVYSADTLLVCCAEGTTVTAYSTNGIEPISESSLNSFDYVKKELNNIKDDISEIETDISEIETDIEGNNVALTGSFVNKYVNRLGGLTESQDYGSYVFDVSGLKIVKISTPLNNQYVRSWGLLKNNEVIDYGDLTSVKREDAIDLSIYDADFLYVCCATGTTPSAYSTDGLRPSSESNINAFEFIKNEHGKINEKIEKNATDINKLDIEINGETQELTGTFVSEYINAYGAIRSIEGYGSYSYDISSITDIVTIKTSLNNVNIRAWGLLKDHNVVAYGDLSSVKREDTIDLSMYDVDTLYVCCATGTTTSAIVNRRPTTEIDRGTLLNKRGNLNSGNKFILEANDININKEIAFSAKITTFNSILIGHGKNNNWTSWVEITGTQIIIHNYTISDSVVTVNHGLTIENTIQVCITREVGDSSVIRLVSSGESFETTQNWLGYSGEIFVESSGSTLADCTFGWICKGYDSPVYMFGDSYFQPRLNRRWIYYLLEDEHTNVLLDSFPGRNSIQAYSSFINSLKHGNPEYVVWCLGMNDPDNIDSINSSWKNVFDNVKAVCEARKIKMIAATIPSSSNAAGTEISQINTYKNEYVRNSGLMYIDFSHAVVKNETTGEWYDGMIYAPGEIHPSAKGAVALYQQALADFPKLMSL